MKNSMDHYRRKIDIIEKEEYFKEEEFVKPFEKIFDEVKGELTNLSIILFDLLPDKSIGPEERIERLGRLIPSTILESEYHRTARLKLNIIQRKLDYLVPDTSLSYENKIKYLVSLANKLVPENIPFIEKLEKINDYRRTDNGARL